ncbi:MAG: hypothetical protein RBR15_13420 [Sphaerochaeta sp.]|nr:hypothetical protein [Sphaerochaeta sp.]
MATFNDFLFINTYKNSTTGAAAKVIIVAVGRCLNKDGRYSTIYPAEIVRNKQYSISAIQSVLDNKAYFSMASPRQELTGGSGLREYGEM